MTDELFSIERIFEHMTTWEPLLSMPAASRILRVGRIPRDEPIPVGGEGWSDRRGAFYLLQQFTRPSRG